MQTGGRVVVTSHLGHSPRGPGPFPVGPGLRGDLLPEVAAIAAFMVVALAAAVATFRKRLV